MTITQIILLQICAFILILVLATVFKRHQRIILWSAAILIFTGNLLLVGLGTIDLVKDDLPNITVIAGVFFALFLSCALACGAGKLHSKNRGKDKQTVQAKNSQSEGQDTPERVALSSRLDTPLARAVFAKVVEAGYMEEDGSHYRWRKGTKALLAYMCGRIYKKGMTYVEPFVGGGAVLFWILQEYPNITRTIINDINAELICTYRVIKSDVENLIIELTWIQSEYLTLDEAARKNYYLSQRERFNERDNSAIETVALFIFLNRTCFNGLYRINSKRKFNVPHGKYSNPRICDEEPLRADSAVLQRVEILCGDCVQTGKYAGDNVLYYFAPPYRPLTETSAFTSYAKDGFDDVEQMRLRDFCEQITEHKSLFIASNSDPQNVDKRDDFFDHLYKMFSIKRVSTSRMINSKGNGRGAISEIMISNVANAY